MPGGDGFWQALEATETTEGVEITVDDTTGFAVSASSVWGVTSTGRAYHDPAGAAAGEDATYHAAARPYLST